MLVEDAAKANELITALQHGLEQQQEVLDGLKASLEQYQEFLIQSMEEIRNG